MTVEIPKSLADLPVSSPRWVGQSVRRKEDPALLTGRTTRGALVLGQERWRLQPLLLVSLGLVQFSPAQGNTTKLSIGHCCVPPVAPFFTDR